MNIGDKAPEILGMDENGQEIRLADYKGKKLILYFYPKDMTSGCTAQACSLRDHYDELQTAGYAVLGVSTQDGTSHQKFIAKNELPFHLIADTGHTLHEAFDTWGENVRPQVLRHLPHHIHHQRRGSGGAHLHTERNKDEDTCRTDTEQVTEKHLKSK